jgi:hypothetical protein
MSVESKLSLIAIVLGAVSSIALPVWALRAANFFGQYAPVSWVVAGFAGLLIYALSVWLIGVGRSRFVRSKYDAKFMQETGGVDPLSKVFEQKRIFLNDFVLPSQPLVDGKTFVECEIVGPANMFFQSGNGADLIRHGGIDAVALAPGATFDNGITFRNCTFRACTFHRVTIFFSPDEASRLEQLDWIKWISVIPRIVSSEGSSATEDTSGQSSPDIKQEKPR